MKYLSDINVKGKLVLLRSDLNSDVKKGKIIANERLKQAASTIKLLKQKGAKVVVIAHQGNPKKSDFLSLKQHCKILNQYTKVSFINDILSKKAKKAITSLKAKEALLLENMRFEKDEFEPEKKDNKFISFARLFEVYINDAFSVAHRNHSSITLFPKLLPCAAGPLIEKELKALEQIQIKNPLYILGGAKPESDIKLLGKNPVLACGLFGQLCLIAKGKDLGYQNTFLRKAALVKGDYKAFLKSLKRKLYHVQLPMDFAVEKDAKRKELLLTEFPCTFEIKDIGQETLSTFKEEIKNAKAIYMKGPAGESNDARYAKGTVEILKAIAASRAFSIVGGGHLSETIKAHNIPQKKFNHLSLSGGALLTFIAKEKLPGLAALGYYKR